VADELADPRPRHAAEVEVRNATVPKVVRRERWNVKGRAGTTTSAGAPRASPSAEASAPRSPDDHARMLAAFDRGKDHAPLQTMDPAPDRARPAAQPRPQTLHRVLNGRGEANGVQQLLTAIAGETQMRHRDAVSNAVTRGQHLVERLSRAGGTGL
jgi:hypothetical protein